MDEWRLFSELREAVDRIETRVTFYLAMVHDVAMSPAALGRIVPGLTPERLMIQPVAEALQRFADAVGEPYLFGPPPWDWEKFISRQAGSNNLEPISVLQWTQGAKLCLSQITRIDSRPAPAAQDYLNIDAKQDAIIALEGAFVSNRSVLTDSLNNLGIGGAALASAPGGLPPWWSLPVGQLGRLPWRAFAAARQVDPEKDWPFVRPRVAAVAKTADFPRPPSLVSKELFGLAPPERARVATVAESMLKLKLFDINSIFGGQVAAAPTPPPEPEPDAPPVIPSYDFGRWRGLTLASLIPKPPADDDEQAPWRKPSEKAEPTPQSAAAMASLLNWRAFQPRQEPEPPPASPGTTADWLGTLYVPGTKWPLPVPAPSPEPPRADPATWTPLTLARLLGEAPKNPWSPALLAKFLDKEK